jgi:CRP-like cAMP-binding protein
MQPHMMNPSRIVNSGDFSVAIAGGRRTATVSALEKCVVLRLPHAEFDTLVLESEALREAVARVIRHRLRDAALRVALPHAVGSDSKLLNLLSNRATWVRLERNEVLWEQGATADGWYVLVSGELSIFVNEHGVRRKIGTVRRGEVFGYNNICIYFDHPPATYFLPTLWAITLVLLMSYMGAAWLLMRAEVLVGTLKPHLYRVLSGFKLFEAFTLVAFSTSFAVSPDGWDETLYVHTVPFFLLQIGMVSLAMTSTIH